MADGAGDVDPVTPDLARVARKALHQFEVSTARGTALAMLRVQMLVEGLDDGH